MKNLSWVLFGLWVWLVLGFISYFYFLLKNKLPFWPAGTLPTAQKLKNVVGQLVWFPKNFGWGK